MLQYISFDFFSIKKYKNHSYHKPPKNKHHAHQLQAIVCQLADLQQQKVGLRLGSLVRNTGYLGNIKCSKRCWR